MPRKIRVEYPGAIYHVLSRGDRQEAIFHDDVDRQDFRHGWCLGSEAFRQQMLGLIDGHLGEHHAGELRWESAEAKADRIIEEELQRLGWTAADLAQRHKTDPAKVAIGARLRRETTLPIRWIADRLRMGTWKSVRTRLQDWKSH